ncbi:cysteine--1-D-myo-inosityl 2-amino-2-deoxy-alpha-D-glucopyranoside ligase [Leucobacter sp. M11]|uniref:cysteine--1-D-myo-inosityl 2-amino-2-deoxy-alpha-D-glucopyranoside ligase n=1 Tax=Leucobacter sp. M11 TaxID=2993565 RepID=UPI002D808F25|nr:cysteine--1-D-myo-inosityl 2-amino-2-deoxy-alpha-D-glucopyranoside ligase [Leucobacter sp. M11]MEB4616319.1 cysteine--1-D-myo-inosityl 2-amino-2-deoxy-alpha-D-glucopyranoside ligase [Leucobacter sp. M11]
MRTWTPPDLPTLPTTGQAPRLFNTASGRLEHPPLNEGRATLYVCGITPYDATHIGHAFTYLAYDTLQRAWRDAGLEVEYAQNITDIDDPLLERAAATNVSWESLAENQIALFRSDMFRLGLIPPDHFVAVTEQIDLIAQSVQKLRQLGFAYPVATDDAAGDDLYFDTQAASEQSQWRLGDVAPYERELMLLLSAERGGDPDRVGKRDPLDPLLWRAARAGEPSWGTVLGLGRPGWHIECSAIAVHFLGNAFTVQGGGNDLIFPHHEFSAGHATAMTGTPMAHIYSHVGLVSYQGHKMSKSRGNLVFVSKLLDGGTEPAAVRLALLAHHYREEWEWFEEDLITAERRLIAWRMGSSGSGTRHEGQEPASATQVIEQLRQALANDLDTPVMLAALDAAWDRGVDRPELLVDAVESLLGVTLKRAERL